MKYGHQKKGLVAYRYYKPRNNILINIPLTLEDEKWLCDRAEASEIILNRVLRYPIKSDIISDWVKSNFKNDQLRNRRAELLSWIIDQEPQYVIDHQILIDDFEYANKIDLKAIQDYNFELEINKIIERELGDTLPIEKQEQDWSNETDYEEIVAPSAPELKLSTRFYGMIMESSNNYPVAIPDFDKTRQEFYAEIMIHHKTTMIWSIGYSRIDNETKSNLLKKYYCNETYYSLFKVCKRTKNAKLLRWILEQQ